MLLRATAWLSILLLMSVSILVFGSGASEMGSDSQPRLEIEATGHGYVVISWEMEGNGDMQNLSAFRILRAAPGENLTQISLEGYLERSYNDTDVKNGVEYDYVVSALYEGDARDHRSDPAAAIPGGVQGAPTVTDVIRDEEGNIITWEFSDDDGGFPAEMTIVQRSAGDGDFDLIGTVKGNNTTYTDLSARARTDHYYRVIVINEMGPSKPSLEYHFIPSPLPPGTPSIVDLEMGQDHIMLEWHPPADDGGSPITGYRIWRINGDGNETQLNTVPDVNRYNDTDVQPGVNYTYRLSALSEAGSSDPTENRTVMIPVGRKTDNGGSTGGSSDGGNTALILGLLVGALIIMVSIMIYLKMTDRLDQEEVEIVDVNEGRESDDSVEKDPMEVKRSDEVISGPAGPS